MRRQTKSIEKYAECGAFGHAWFETPDYSWNPLFGVPIVLRCERCNSERHEAVTYRTGEIINRNYDYPSDYSYPKGQRPTRDDFRRALLVKRRRQQKQDPEVIIPFKRKKVQ